MILPGHLNNALILGEQTFVVAQEGCTVDLTTVCLDIELTVEELEVVACPQ